MIRQYGAIRHGGAEVRAGTVLVGRWRATEKDRELSWQPLKIQDMTWCGRVQYEYCTSTGLYHRGARGESGKCLSDKGKGERLSATSSLLISVAIFALQVDLIASVSWAFGFEQLVSELCDNILRNLGESIFCVRTAQICQME